MGDIDNPVVLTEPQALIGFQNAVDIAQAPSRRNQPAKSTSVEPGYTIVATNPNFAVMALDASNDAKLDTVLGAKDANATIVNPHDRLVTESEPDRPIRIGKGRYCNVSWPAQ